MQLWLNHDAIMTQLRRKSPSIHLSKYLSIHVWSYLCARNIGRNVDLESYYRKLSGLTDIIEINIEIKIV